MRKNYSLFTKRLDRVEETRVIGYIYYKTFGCTPSFSRELLFDPQKNMTIDIDSILDKYLNKSNRYYVHCYHPQNSVFIASKEEITSVLEEQVQHDLRTFDIDIINMNMESSPIISCTHDGYVFLFRNEANNPTITSNTYVTQEVQTYDYIWCFIELNKEVPTGLFSTVEQAKLSVFKLNKEGILLKYPIDQTINICDINIKSILSTQTVISRNIEIITFVRDTDNNLTYKEKNYRW